MKRTGMAVLLVAGVSAAAGGLWFLGSADLAGRGAADRASDAPDATGGIAAPAPVPPAVVPDAKASRPNARGPRRRPRARARDEAVESATKEFDALRAAAEALRAKLRQRIPHVRAADLRLADGATVLGDTQNGSWVLYDASGRVISGGAWKDGKRHGLWIETSTDGSRTEIEYEGGAKHGREATWFADGAPRFIGSNDTGNATGVWTSWHPGGVLASTREFVGGKVHGVMRVFHKSGAVESESTYAHGLDVAPTYGWREDGSLEFVMPYTDGRRQGEALWYHPNGRIAARGTYVDGALDGEYTTYSTEGAEVLVELWDRGLKVWGPGERTALAERNGDDRR